MRKSMALGLAAIILASGLALTGCGGKKDDPLNKKQTIQALLSPAEQLDSIKSLTAQYAGDVRSIMAQGDTSWAVYHGGLLGDKIKSQLRGAGYMDLVPDGAGAMYTFTDSGLKLIDQDPTFARNYFELDFPSVEREKAFNELDESNF